jgi:hypothetical protein
LKLGAKEDITQQSLSNLKRTDGTLAINQLKKLTVAVHTSLIRSKTFFSIEALSTSK